jgi:hypothetical protein
VEINTGVVGTDIIIRSFGEGIITGHRFALNDAKEIKQVIESHM